MIKISETLDKNINERSVMNDKLKELKHRNLKLTTGFLCISILAIIIFGNISIHNKKKQQELQESIAASREAYLEAERKAHKEAATQSIHDILTDDTTNASNETFDPSYTDVLTETDSDVIDETDMTYITDETIKTAYNDESSASNDSKSSIHTGASAHIDPDEFSAASSGGSGISVRGEPVYSSGNDKTKSSSYSSYSSSSSSKSKTTSKSKKKSKSSSKREDYLEDLAEEYMEAEGLDYDSAYEAAEDD